MMLHCCCTVAAADASVAAAALQNIKKKQYGSSEAFVADVKWILHNCIVFNGSQSPSQFD